MNNQPFDLEMLKNHYTSLSARIQRAKKSLNRPLTLSEKILYSHVHKDSGLSILDGEKTMFSFHQIA